MDKGRTVGVEIEPITTLTLHLEQRNVVVVVLGTGRRLVSVSFVL